MAPQERCCAVRRALELKERFGALALILSKPPLWVPPTERATRSCSRELLFFWARPFSSWEEGSKACSEPGRVLLEPGLRPARRVWPAERVLISFQKQLAAARRTVELSPIFFRPRLFPEARVGCPPARERTLLSSP